MPTLAPRPPGKRESKGPSSGSTATGNKAVLDRKRAAGFDLKTSITQFPSLDWDEVEDVTEHVVDIACTISHSQIGSTGNVVASMNCPKDYAQAVVAAHLASMDMMVYVRVYRVGKERFVAKQRLLAEAAAETERQLQALQFGTQGTLDDLDLTQ